MSILVYLYIFLCIKIQKLIFFLKCKVAWQYSLAGVMLNKFWSLRVALKNIKMSKLNLTFIFKDISISLAFLLESIKISLYDVPDVEQCYCLELWFFAATK